LSYVTIRTLTVDMKTVTPCAWL